MPLNYSKWDQLELSDDSDIEGHPNVDKKSLIRWKQRDIHEKREQRKAHIAALHAEISCNAILLPRLQSLAAELAAPPNGSTAQLFNATAERLQASPSPDKPPTNAPDQPTYDDMVLSLLKQVGEAARTASGGDEEKLEKKLVEGVKEHVVKLGEQQEKLQKELDAEVAEQKKHITSEDIHEGWDSKYVPPQPAPEPVKHAHIDTKGKGKSKATTTTTEYEVLNPKATAPSSTGAEADDDEDQDYAELPELTPGLQLFSELPLHAYERSWELIQQHRDIVVPGAYDALLVAAFRAQHAGRAAYAKQCVHQGLLLQYAEKLGGDGVRVFFKKMIARDTRAVHAFVQDVEGTYKHLVERVAISKREEEEAAASAGTEQIQLVPENPTQTISFNVPDGPPPEDLRLEGEGTEDLDIEEVRKALQMRWDVFAGFPRDMQEALREGTLDGVNKVLGGMKVEEAEEVVRLLDVAGILHFAEGGIRDETGK